MKLRDALNSLTVDRLTVLVKLLPEAPPRRRKADLVDFIARKLVRKATLRDILTGLDEIQTGALAEALYNGAGCLDLDRCRAKYGRLPASEHLDGRHGGRGQATGFDLLVYTGAFGPCVPEELVVKLTPLVAAPQPLSIESLAALPQIVAEQPLAVRESETAALSEVGRMLRLVQQGRLAVSPKTRRPSAATCRRVAEHLIEGDFYEDPPGVETYEMVGPIRAFAWPMVLQGGKLASPAGGKLALTRAGLKALGRPPAEILKSLWRGWCKTRLVDELSRIDAIKGQRYGARGLTAIVPRRQVVAAALAHCPVGEWVAMTDFTRYMRAEGFDFGVVNDPWSLYVGERRYGSLGYAGHHDWAVLQKRYLLAVLFEYAATLGLVDVAYIDPGGATRDYDLWGTDCLPFLSRYDGLMYFRLNALGAWCLDLAEDYARTDARSSTRLRVTPGLVVEAVGDGVDPEVAMRLEPWAEREGDGRWRLDGARTLEAMENGLDVDELERFLAARDDQPLPEPVEAFFKRCRRQADAVRPAGAAVVFECRDAKTATEIAEHPETGKLCRRTGQQGLVVAVANEERFRKTLRRAGFGIRAR